MIDIKMIRENPDFVQNEMRKKDPTVRLDEIVELDRKIREIAIIADELKNKRNIESKVIGKIKDKNERSEKAKKMKEVSERIKEYDAEIREKEEKLRDMLLRLPNPPHESVPVSDNEDDKIIVKEHGSKKEFGFEIRNHVEIGTELGIFDFERGAKISQSMFPVYVGDGARLEIALINYFIDFLTGENGFKLVGPPLLVNESTMYTSGNLPKFGEQLYKCKDDELYLIPTSEVPLTSMHRDEILNEDDLPIYYCAYTPCFRREAGAHGKGERGLIRVHQFNKVEMFKFVKPDKSYDELDHLIATAEKLVEGLGLHYRTALLVTSDIAQQSAKTCDIEVWLPGQQAYYEVSSCSNCEDYQARRGAIRYRPEGEKKTRFVHSLNGSGLATSRLMVSIIETYQQEDGSVEIPEVLRKYMGGQEIIRKQ